MKFSNHKWQFSIIIMISISWNFEISFFENSMICQIQSNFDWNLGVFLKFFSYRKKKGNSFLCIQFIYVYATGYPFFNLKKKLLIKSFIKLHNYFIPKVQGSVVQSCTWWAKASYGTSRASWRAKVGLLQVEICTSQEKRASGFDWKPLDILPCR